LIGELRSRSESAGCDEKEHLFSGRVADPERSEGRRLLFRPPNSPKRRIFDEAKDLKVLGQNIVLQRLSAFGGLSGVSG